jgi:catechol 2,3-dioxygenase-like lactoylglutathione lyase family enzyme
VTATPGNLVSGDGDVPAILAIHHVTLPVRDLQRSADWYAQALGFRQWVELEEEDRVVAVVLAHDCGAELMLRLDPRRAAALAGFDTVTLRVADRATLEGTVCACRARGVAVSDVFPAHLGWAARLTDPDGIGIRLHTAEPLDDSDR